MSTVRLLLAGLCVACSCDARSQKIADLSGDADLHMWTDTANVYVLRDGDHGLLINLGDGSVLAELPKLGIRQLDWVLFTDHHREQVQGYPKLAAHSPRIAVPAAERQLFEQPLSFRKMRPMLSDRFTVHSASYVRPFMHSVRVDLTFSRMDDFTWRGHKIRCVETKGASPGGMSYLLEDGSEFIAFTGDVMVDGARMHNWFDTEWDYGFAAGIYALNESASLLERYNPKLMLPSHGPIIEDATHQLGMFQRKLRELEPLYVRGYSVMKFSGADQDRMSTPTAVPHVWQTSPHLFKFKGPNYAPNFHLLLADDGHGLVVDCGLFDPAFLDRAIEGMRQHLGLKQIDACIITHMHGDHMLQANHLRSRWGAQVWTLDRIKDKCERPERYDYAAPVQSYGKDLTSVSIDRSFHDGETFDWHGYKLTVDWMPGQTEFALAVQGIIDGRKVVFTGDNIFGNPRDRSENGHEAVVARNSSILEEGYIYGAEYLRRLQPDLLLGGHSYVMDRPHDFIERYYGWSLEMRKAFQSLSSDEDYRYWYDPYWVRAEPYRTILEADKPSEITVHVRNFRNRPQKHRIEIHAPDGIVAEPAVLEGQLGPEQRGTFTVRLKGNAKPAVRIIAFDITLDGNRYGEYFDAIVETR